jgi:hypothetical protein
VVSRRRHRRVGAGEAAPRPLVERRRGREAAWPNKLQRRKQAEIDPLTAEGRTCIGELSKRDLLIAGAALYAGEGSKTDGAVKFANSDARMIGLFLAWFRHIYAVDESGLRVHLYLHAGLDLDAAVAFWSEVTAVPAAQFYKPYRAVPDAGIRHSKHLMGCATVCYPSMIAHRTIMGLVRALLLSDFPFRGSSAGRAFGC